MSDAEPTGDVAGFLRENSAHCPDCGLQLAGVEQPRCPACGCGLTVAALRRSVGAVAESPGLGVETPDPRCPMCKYNLAGLTGETCPECGQDLSPAGEIYPADRAGPTPKRRKMGRLATGVIAAAVSAAGATSLVIIARDATLSPHLPDPYPHEYFVVATVVSAVCGGAVGCYAVLRKRP